MQTNFDELEQSEQRLNKEKREAQREVSLYFPSFLIIYIYLYVFKRNGETKLNSLIKIVCVNNHLKT